MPSRRKKPSPTSKAKPAVKPQRAKVSLRPSSAVPVPVPSTSVEGSKEREHEITRLLSLCLPHVEIVRRMERKYGLSSAYCHNVINRAYADWEKRASVGGKDMRRERMRDTLGLLLDRALGIMDVKSAIVAADRLCKMDGLYAPDKIEIADGTVAANEPDRVRARIRDLVLRHGEKLGLPVGMPTGAPVPVQSVGHVNADVPDEKKSAAN